MSSDWSAPDVTPGRGSDATGNAPLVVPPPPPGSLPPMRAPAYTASVDAPAAPVAPAPMAPAPMAPAVVPAPPALHPTAPQHPLMAPQHPLPPYPLPQHPLPQHPGAAFVPKPPLTPGVRVARAIIFVVVGVVVLILGGAFVTGIIMSLDEARRPGPPPSAAPIESSAPSDGAPAATIGTELEAKVAEYESLRESGELWQRLPETAFNETAVTAFIYFLTDMQLATNFGVDEETAQEFASEAAEYERRLLAEEPLGSDIHIALSNGRVFEYDGETGEGGFTGG